MPREKSVFRRLGANRYQPQFSLDMSRGLKINLLSEPVPRPILRRAIPRAVQALKGPIKG